MWLGELLNETAVSDFNIDKTHKEQCMQNFQIVTHLAPVPRFVTPNIERDT